MLYFSHFRKRHPCFNTNWQHKVSQINRFRIPKSKKKKPKTNAINRSICNFVWILGAIMRRASAELEKRRASLGTAKGLRSDGTLDPYYVAILFRDSRGVSIYRRRLKVLPLQMRLYIIFGHFSCPSPIHFWKNTIFAIQVSSNYFVGSRKHTQL